MKKISEATFNELKETFDKAIQEAFGAGVKEGREGAQQTVDEPETKLNTVKRHAEVGEWIFIVNAQQNSEDYSNGDILKVTELKNSPYIPNGTVDVEDIPRHIWPSEYEVIIEDEVPLQDEPTPLTPNQQRKELNQRAREFVEDRLNGEDLIINYDFYKNPTISFFRKDNKTTCVITPENTMLDRFVGRSFCSKGDVFNEWIGKLIALYKAMGIDIPQEFIDAVQPDEVVVGMLVEPKDDTRYDGDSYEVNKIANGRAYDLTGAGWVPKGELIIIDDTSAIYGTD